MKSVDFMHKLCAKLRFDGSPNPTPYSLSYVQINSDGRKNFKKIQTSKLGFFRP